MKHLPPLVFFAVFTAALASISCNKKSGSTDAGTTQVTAATTFADLKKETAALAEKLQKQSIDTKSYATQATAYAQKYIETTGIPPMIRYTEAKRLCDTAIAADPANEDARKILKKLEDVSSAWVE